MPNSLIYILIILFSILVIGIVTVASRYRREIKAARERIASLGSRVIKTDSGPIEYARVGTGYPVLVVHGAMGGFDQGLWLAHSFNLSKYQVISISRFGYLRSPLPADAKLDLQADAFACLLDALEIRQAAVFAVSAGSTSAIRFAARHPERISALILLGPDAPGSVQMAIPPRFVFDTLLRSDFIYWALVTFFGRWVQNAIGLVPKGYVLTPEYEALIKKIQLGDLPVSRRMDGMIFESYTSAPEFNVSVTATSPYPLNRIKTPVLVINAADDPIAIPENVRGLAEQMPNARLFVAPDGGHFLFGHTEEVKAEIARFLRSNVAELQTDRYRLTHAKPAPRRASGNPSFEKIDTYIAEQIKRLNIPGAALAIVEGDQIVHLRGFGQARPGGEAPAPQTPFSIGSITKSFTALAVMQLVEAGKVELDAPVQRYLPWFRVADTCGSDQITVRHLLNQTSGLPLLPGWQLLADFDNRLDATERQMRALSPLILTHPTGAAFEYSNLNYNLLGLVIEAASGESYAAYIQNHIFDPLEMSHSHTSKTTAKRDGMAVGHQSWFGVPIAVPDLPVANGSLPSGQLISSAEDMGHYLIAHLNGGRSADAQILSPEGIAELHRPAVEARLLNDAKGWYGMGWYIEEQGQTRILHHSGLEPDFYAYMALLPEQKKGVVLLVNVDHFTMQLTMSEVGAGVARLLSGTPPAPIRFGAIPWAQRGLLLIPALQIVDVAVTLGLVRRWHRDPQRRPSRGRMCGQHILLPLIPNLLVALTLIPILGQLRGFLMLFAPDFSWIARISGGFAGIWSFLRTVLILVTLRKTS